MLKIDVSQFGPVVRGEVTLKPLTVFVGPNNSGKSYLAMLTYAISNSFRSPYRGLDPMFGPVGYPRYRKEFNRKAVKALRDWLKTIETFPKGKIKVQDLPAELRQSIFEMARRYLDFQAVEG